MKKAIAVLMVFVIIVCTTLSVSADEVVGNIYEIEDVTVVFDPDSQLSTEQQEMIAQLIVNPEYGTSQANLICNIFGHKNTQESVSTVTHMAKETNPRCFQEFFIITVCSRCNESTVERTGYRYITCCPED
jgi:hypothetical protein